MFPKNTFVITAKKNPKRCAWQFLYGGKVEIEVQQGQTSARLEYKVGTSNFGEVVMFSVFSLQDVWDV